MAGVAVAVAFLLPGPAAVATAAESGPALQPGEVFQDCAECPEMVGVPPGSFRMGDLNGGGDADEGPARRVDIARPFAIARFETTFAEWDACVAAGGCPPGAGDLGWGREERPAINVSPEDAEAFVDWLSRLAGARYRLPSEAEWEYAARAGSETRYPWGNDIGRNRANCDGCGSGWDDARTAPVGSFPANAFGVHDTAGNVYEWVADCGRYSYQGAPSDGSVWGSGWGLSLPHDARRVLAQPAQGLAFGQPGPQPGRFPGHQRRFSRRERPPLSGALRPAGRPVLPRTVPFGGEACAPPRRRPGARSAMAPGRHRSECRRRHTGLNTTAWSAPGPRSPPFEMDRLGIILIARL